MKERAVLICIGVLCSILLSGCVSPNKEGRCDTIKLDAVGDVEIARDKVLAVAGSGRADHSVGYIVIAPPATDQTSVTDSVREMHISMNTRRMDDVVCELRTDVVDGLGFLCAEALPYEGLQLVVWFKSESEAGLHDIVRELESYVMKDVLNCVPRGAVEQ